MAMAFKDRSGDGGSTVETVGEGIKTAYPARAEAVTPNDSTVFEKPSAVYVGSAGTVVVTPWSPETPAAVTFNIQDGGVVPVMVKQVKTGGTASDLVRVF